ncbi:MAG TPA: type II/IV secretion system protein, partial [Burkholderiales bacterium]
MPANTPAPAPHAETRKQPSGTNPPSGGPAKTQKVADRKLTIEQLVTDLVADKLVAPDVAEKLLTLRRNLRSSDVHPLIILADQKWKDPRNPKKLLTLEVLTEWLAGKVGLPYLHIDPFKIDFAAVTKVMSNAYAERFKILPVRVNLTEVVIATCEPYVREWEAELARIMRLEIRRVIANPQDINGFLVEFYNLARSVKSASELHGAA